MSTAEPLIDMGQVVAEVKRLGMDARIECSGGNVMTVYVGQPDERGRYEACAGPGWSEDGEVLASPAEFSVGPDDDSDDIEPLWVANAKQAAAALVRLARMARWSEP